MSERFVQPTWEVDVIYDGKIVGKAEVTETSEFVKRDTRPNEPFEVEMQITYDTD